MECVKINTIIPGCLTYSDDLAICLECQDSKAILGNNCLTCILGYYKDTSSNTCKSCHLKCTSCTFYDQCTECKSFSANIPECDCILTDQYRDPFSFECLNCSEQCQTCEDISSNCLTCSNNYLTPPYCKCDSLKFNIALSTPTSCIPIKCSFKCLTCENDPSHCTSCQVNRDDPPYCNCIKNYFEVEDKCLFCNSHFYYDQITNQCKECDYSCKQCSISNDKCTECLDELILKNSTCLCSDLSLLYMSPTSEIKCQSQMNVEVSLKVENFEYDLILTFEESLEQIDFESHTIDSLIYIYISNINQQSFYVDKTVQKGKILMLSLKFKECFSTSFGNILFLNNQMFMSNSAQRVLNYKYTFIPLVFKIGPLIISDTSWQPNESLSQINDRIKGINQLVLSFFQQFQVLFSVLNTLQPCVSFLMVRLTLPPNLFQSLKIIGLLIFPTVLDYSTEPSSEMKYYMFGIPLQDSISSNKSQVFNRFGYSNSMLVNIPYVIISYFLWFFLQFITSIAIKINSMNHTNLEKYYKISQFISNRINSNCETSLLIVSTAILNQFVNLDDGQFLNRWSLYSAIMLLLILVYQNMTNYLNLNFNRNINYINNNNFLNLVEKLDYQKRPQLIRTYFFMQIMKKYLLSAMIIFLETYPSVLCSCSAALFFILMIATIWIMPYKLKLRNVIKIGGEICMTSAWLIVLLKFVPFESNFESGGIIIADKMEEYLLFGEIVMIILVSFNILYLLDFMIFEIILKIWNIIYSSKPKEQQQKENGQQFQFYDQGKNIQTNQLKTENKVRLKLEKIV